MILGRISDETLRSLYWDDGKSINQIAKVLNCSPAAVCMRMKDSAIPVDHSRKYKPTEKQIAAWKTNGKKLSTYPATIAALKNNKRSLGKRAREYEFGGHEKKRADGYIKVYVPDHPHATKDGYVMKHRLIMERHIGRILEEDESVHHVNHIRDDNRIENLRLMTKREHMAMHMRERYAKRREEC